MRANHECENNKVQIEGRMIYRWVSIQDVDNGGYNCAVIEDSADWINHDWLQMVATDAWINHKGTDWINYDGKGV